jgi:simple sugar transport system permease protein
MLNFIATAAVLALGRHGLFAPETVHTAPIVPGARLPALGLAGSAANLAFFLALAAALLVWFTLARSRRGFELRAAGRSPLAAEAAGIDLGWVTISVMALSGGLAGLVGSSTVLGYKGYFEEGMGSGAGFMGIAVALLGRSHPLGVIAAALLFGTLAHGGLAVNAIVPKEIVEVTQGIVILGVAATAGQLRRGGTSWTR